MIELAGLAPAPLCGAILADFGANVIRVDKVFNIHNRPNQFLYFKVRQCPLGSCAKDFVLSSCIVQKVYSFVFFFYIFF